MTTNDQSPRREAAFYTSIRNWGLTRGDHGVVGGVIEGVGDKIGLDRTPARILAVLLLFMTQGFFFALYAAAWALLPDRSGRIILQDFGRGTPNVGALIGIGIFAIIGLSANPGSWSQAGDWNSVPFGGLWPLIPLGIAAGAVALVIVLVARNKDGRGPSETAAPPQRGELAVPSQRRAPGAAKPASATTAQPASAAGVAGATSAAAAEDAATSGAHAAPPVPPLPPVPPRPRTPGPGSAIYLLALSTAVFAAAGIWFLERQGELAVSPVVAWFAVAVVIIGGAIILTGALGRRVGFLGFLATTFIIGWVIGLAGERALNFADGGVSITIDGVRHTIGDGHGWFDESADGIECGPYDVPASDLAGATRYVVERGQESVTVSSPTAVVVVPRDASLSFASASIVSGSLSIESRDVTCSLERAHGSLYSILRTGDTITVNIDTPHAIIAIEEN